MGIPPSRSYRAAYVVFGFGMGVLEHSCTEHEERWPVGGSQLRGFWNR